MCSASSPICMDFPLLIASTLPASESRDLAPVASIASEVFAYGLVRLFIGAGFRLGRVGHRLGNELVDVRPVVGFTIFSLSGIPGESFLRSLDSPCEGT